jgi:NADH:ubiquinone oxidoreductase subunit F (NADH-binding)/NADH:ubiquinone oxidoreductase subunit E/NAD-dependent dihydropyrimidine dehydrogenase PreA subunit
MTSHIAGPSPVDLSPLRGLIAAWPELTSRNLIAVLQRTQALYGYLPMEALDYIADAMRLSEARVYGVATFYSQFRLRPQGEHVIQVCNGTACNVKGAEDLLDELMAVLGIRAGETTPDGKVTLEIVNCVGACGVAPAIVVDGEVHGRMTGKAAGKLAQKLLHTARTAPTPRPEKPAGAPLPGRSFLERCCDKCRTRPGTPCPNFLLCRLEGISCHDDPSCVSYRDELRRLVEHSSARFIATVYLCKGLTCDASGEASVYRSFLEEVEARGLSGKIEFVETGCQGLCEVGPIVQLKPLEAFYCRVKPGDVAEVVGQHILGGQIVERLLFAPGHVTEGSIPFYARQERRVLSNCGRIDPENIDEYIARGGYRALYRALKEMTPEQVIAEVSAAGLRGRGGGGFPTGTKWQIARGQADAERYLVCNADEGDPGAFMDRSVLEGDPNRVIEGMLIAAHAIGAHHAFIYCRAEYPLAIRRLEIALEQARAYGLLGANILGTGQSVHIEIVQGAGAFVCGEETALINSVEGGRGTASNKPPFPAERGFNRHPTCVNNVETFANVPLIVAHGAEWFRAAGTPTSAGTKIFSLSGKVRNTGLVEVPMGITLEALLHGIGGGAPEGSTIKAAQTGGPSGGCIPADRMSTPVDYESLRKLGGMMGSGGLVVTDSSTCMVSFAKFFLSFTQHESCGKCIPCREGTKRMLEILERITDGKGKREDLGELRHLAAVISRSSACGLGQSAPNPVVSTLRYFEHEYVSHIVETRCAAGVCRSLLTYHILPNCRGCGICERKCPVPCISGSKGEVYVIDNDRCIKCGECHRVCPFGAVART